MTPPRKFRDRLGEASLPWATTGGWQPPVLRPLVVGIFIVIALTGCASLPPEYFAHTQPALDPMAYFTGHTHSWGVFETPAGNPSKRFTTDCRGHRAGDTLVLDQTFTYEDGRTHQRHWHIQRVDAHHYEATANDVVGVGSGEAFGNAFHWEYTVALQPGNPLFNVRLKQWMYLQPDGRTLLNRGSVSACGFEVAQVSELFRRD